MVLVPDSQVKEVSCMREEEMNTRTHVSVYICVVKMELVLPKPGTALSVAYFCADSLITNRAGGGTTATISLSAITVGV